jgi:hypothetical protein
MLTPTLQVDPARHYTGKSVGKAPTRMIEQIIHLDRETMTATPLAKAS